MKNQIKRETFEFMSADLDEMLGLLPNDSKVIELRFNFELGEVEALLETEEGRLLVNENEINDKRFCSEMFGPFYDGYVDIPRVMCIIVHLHEKDVTFIVHHPTEKGILHCNESTLEKLYVEDPPSS